MVENSARGYTSYRRTRDTDMSYEKPGTGSHKRIAGRTLQLTGAALERMENLKELNRGNYDRFGGRAAVRHGRSKRIGPSGLGQ